MLPKISMSRLIYLSVSLFKSHLEKSFSGKIKKKVVSCFDGNDHIISNKVPTNFSIDISSIGKLCEKRGMDCCVSRKLLSKTF